LRDERRRDVFYEQFAKSTHLDGRLGDIYKFENYLSELHPEDNHVKPKIRQELQVLHDAGGLEFVSRDKYRVV